jgi:TrmH family RNA methyltransferase
MAVTQKLKRYQKDFDHSYCWGVYPTLELITYQPERVLGVVLHSRGSKNQGVQKIQQICGQRGIEIIANDKLAEKLADKGNTYAIAVFQKYRSLLDPGRDHLVLVNPSSMGNLGTIIRSMRGFGIADLAVIEPAADYFDPQVIRASMGAHFQISLESFSGFSEYRETHASHHLYTLMTDGKIPLPEAEFTFPTSLVFGEEAGGLGEGFRGLGTSIRIPQTAAIDSLNLAVAVGICLYQYSLSRSVPG